MEGKTFVVTASLVIRTEDAATEDFVLNVYAADLDRDYPGIKVLKCTVIATPVPLGPA